MPDYVYALHDFLPEHEDEVTFHAGERIEVVEKDDLYGDGWWQGRNLAGKVGLFPVSYTAPAPPAGAATTTTTTAEAEPAQQSTSILSPLDEESESESPIPPIASPQPKAPPQTSALFNGDEDYSFNVASAPPDGEMMKATMTDVQKAIEQLGRRRAGTGDGDGEDQRSFSFASTRDGGASEASDTDFDLSDLDGGAGGDGSGADGTEDWHKNARRKLAAKARRAVEEAEKLEAMMNGGGDGRRAPVAPPIEVEMSDESEAEDEGGDFTRTSHFQRMHPGILEEDEGDDGHVSRVPSVLASPEPEDEQKERAEDASVGVAAAAVGDAEVSTAEPAHLDIPPRDESEMPTATAATTSFPVFSPPPPAAASTPAVEDTPHPPSQPEVLAIPERSAARPPSPQRNSYTPIPSLAAVAPPVAASLSMPPPQTHNAVVGDDQQKRNSAPFPTNGIPHSPAASTFLQSKHNSIMSSSSAPSISMPGPAMGMMTVPEATLPHPAQQQSVSPVGKTHPSDWNVDEVVEWLKSKGFDQDVCDKFMEQEITGDVLLELDANLLKAELGIMAYGKRVRIANAISDLRRPPSIEYSDHHPSEHPSPMYNSHSMMHMPGNGIQHHHSGTFGLGQGTGVPVHSRTVSQSQQSHSSFPGSAPTTTGNGHYGYTQSVQSSLGSPLGYGPGQANGHGNGNGFGSPMAESPARPQSDGGLASDAAAAATGIGLGIALSPNAANGNGRPAQLLLSPSDGALKDSAAKSVLAVPGPIGDDDRGAMSEGEAVPTATSMRRRLFGRSHDSAGSVINAARARGESPIPSPTVHESSEKDVKDKESNKGSTKGSAKDTLKDTEKAGDSGRDSVSIGSRHARAKKSIDGGKHAGDRLSIFGSTFSTSLGSKNGKNRKPPPSATSSDDHSTEKSSSKFSLPRLHGPSISMRKGSSTSQRPSTPKTSPKDNAFGDSPEKTSSEEKRGTLRKRTTSTHQVPTAAAATASPTGTTTNGTNGTTAAAGAAVSMVNGISGPIKQGQSILEQIGEPDHVGWMRKRGERYNAWKLRYFVLKGPHLYCLRSNSKTETRLKGYIHIVGYKVTVDENVDPGRYGFRIDHDADKTHYFSSDEKSIVRDWMKAIIKATIGRDYTKPVVSSCNIPTIPLVVAQAMNPAPRPPSPSARDATQKALRRENPNQLSSRDARVLMGLPGPEARDERARVDTFFDDNSSMISDAPPTPKRTQAPPRPSREMRRSLSVRTQSNLLDDSLIEWANSHLPDYLQITDPSGPLCGGLALLRLAESIRGRPSSPPVPDSAFPVDPNDDKLDGLFRLFDFLLDNDVKMGSVSINDVRQGKRDKIIQLLKALKLWEDKRKALANTIMKATAPQGYMVLG